MCWMNYHIRGFINSDEMVNTVTKKYKVVEAWRKVFKRVFVLVNADDDFYFNYALNDIQGTPLNDDRKMCLVVPTTGGLIETESSEGFIRAAWDMRYVATAKALAQAPGLPLEAQAIEMRREEDERKNLVEKLQQALAQVEELRGMLPICSSCKKIRDENDFWYEIELYIASHSQAKFSHSICPDCEEELYPEYSKKRDSAIDGRRSIDDRQAPQEVTFIERRSGIERRSLWGAS